MSSTPEFESWINMELDLSVLKEIPDYMLTSVAEIMKLMKEQKFVKVSVIKKKVKLEKNSSSHIGITEIGNAVYTT